MLISQKSMSFFSARGFNLLEVLVALAIFSVVIQQVLRVHSRSLSQMSQLHLSQQKYYQALLLEKLFELNIDSLNALVDASALNTSEQIEKISHCVNDCQSVQALKKSLEQWQSHSLYKEEALDCSIKKHSAGYRFECKDLDSAAVIYSALLVE